MIFSYIAVTIVVSSSSCNRLGYRMGMCSVLAIWVCWDCILNLYWKRHSTIGGRLAFPVFRGCGGLLLLHWFWGISVYVWTRFRINYIYLFDFDPRIVDTPLTIFEDATDETLVFFIIMLLYYKVGASVYIILKHHLKLSLHEQPSPSNFTD